ncbi:MAG: C10 family peptidase [Candidatus Gracilibacteria bacterium]|nr:C10 family peptidase [Candidatus Gracilibacteria bacterium]
MKKKIFSLVLLFVLFGNPFSFTFAKSKVIYERSENLAKQYIENSLNDDNWKGKNPYISGEGKKFYTDDEKNPSYIEFKISCDNEINCGFILVNSDGNDVVVPIASTSGIGPGELLSLQNEEKINNKNKENKTNKKSNNKLYYFGPMEQYSIDEENEEVISINPQDEIDLVIENDKTLKKEDKEKQKLKAKQELKNRINDYKIKAKEYKKSDEFKKHKEEIKDQILKMPKEEFVFEKLDMAFADETPEYSTIYNSPGASNIFVSGSNSSDCNSRTPCYNQFTSSYTAPVPYTTAVCYSGCSPTAVAILFGYYDRNGLIDLVTGTAPSAGVGTTVQTLVNSIKSHIGTSCVRKGTTNIYYGSTTPSNVYKAKQYALDKGYTKTTSSYITGNISTLFTEIKLEIDSNRPIITHMKNLSDNTEGHATVTYGYKSSPSNSNVVLMNMGWGNITVNGTTTTFSSINQNLGAIYYGGANNKTVYAITKFNIKK